MAILTSCGTVAEKRSENVTRDCEFIVAEGNVTPEELAEIHIMNEVLNAECNRRMARLRKEM